ncbi:MAG: hypothetical protein AAGB10_11280 [Pseudomonadota bacterium]
MDQTRQVEFEAFLKQYRSVVRPVGSIERTRYGMGIDGQFFASFKGLRSRLRLEIERWPEMIAIQISQFRDFSDKLDHVGMDLFRDICERHKLAVLENKFDDNYFSTIEEFALFFLYHEIRAVWVVGTLTQVFEQSMARTYDRNDPARRDVMVTLFKFMMLEISQIQRVYIRYAEYREVALRDVDGADTLSA